MNNNFKNNYQLPSELTKNGVMLLIDDYYKNEENKQNPLILQVKTIVQILPTSGGVSQNLYKGELSDGGLQVTVYYNHEISSLIKEGDIQVNDVLIIKESVVTATGISKLQAGMKDIEFIGKVESKSKIQQTKQGAEYFFTHVSDSEDNGLELKSNDYSDIELIQAYNQKQEFRENINESVQKLSENINECVQIQQPDNSINIESLRQLKYTPINELQQKSQSEKVNVIGIIAVQPYDNTYYCNNCQKEVNYPLKRFILNCCIQDSSGDMFVFLPDPLASKILGFTTEEYSELLQQGNRQEADELFLQNLYKEKVLNILCRQEVYNGVEKINYKVNSEYQFDQVELTKSYLQQIQELEDEDLMNDASY